jgi:hypothetical protein
VRLGMTVGVLAVMGALVPAASATTFSSPLKLTGAAGGEPSIVTDPLGDVFVSGPQGIPSGANGTAGVGFWASHNDGSSFGPAKLIGSDTGGGDSDLLFSKGALYVADLEASTAQICKSTDRGNTFNGIGPTPDPNHCTTTNGGQAGPSDDREWLTAAPDGTLYLTYHEFVSAQPVAFRSDNAGGDTFSNACGSLVTDPTIEANVPTDVTGGTLVAKPVTDSKGNLYVLFSTSTQHENALAAAQGAPSGTFSQLYLAVSHDKCKSFTDYTVYDGEKQNGENTVQFGNIFNDLAIDGADNLYVVGAGYIGQTPFAKTANVYMFILRQRSALVSPDPGGRLERGPHVARRYRWANRGAAIDRLFPHRQRRHGPEQHHGQVDVRNSSVDRRQLERAGLLLHRCGSGRRLPQRRGVQPRDPLRYDPGRPE